MKKIHWLFSFVIISFLFFQCQKEVGFIGGPDTGASVTPDPITASIQGNITNENDQPSAGVTVTAGTSTAVTDANGYFHITNANLDKNTSLITAEKDGYFKGYRVLAATSGCNQVAIKLIRKDLAGTVSSSAGGEASLSNGAKISLPSNGVVIASSNSAYSGDVKVYASYINPKSSDIGKTVPGSFVANDKNGKRVVLSSYGMLAVELSSTSGEKLQIKNGSVATLTMPIASNSFSSAPATISLWYIDEATGIWQEEGSAAKQGSNYVGEVKHFSYWNCDYPYDAANLSFTLQTPDGLPLVDAYVEIKPTGTDSTIGGLAHGYTDSLGQVKGLVPANKALMMIVYNSCYGVVYSQSISAIGANTDLGVIKITGAAANSILTITGTLLDCSNNPVANGYAFITFRNDSRYVKTDSLTGKFTTTYVLCSGAPDIINVTGVNSATQEQGSTTTINTILPTTDAGIVTACGISSKQYIDFSVDGVTFNIGDLASDTMRSVLDSSNVIDINGLRNSADQIGFTANATKAGTFPMVNLFVNNYHYVDLSQPSTVTFTNFPSAIGNFYEGSLTGQFVSYHNTDSAVTHNITGTFRVRRNS